MGRWGEAEPLRTALAAALGAGVLAALAAGLFHFFLSEPLIEIAIALESAGEAGHGEAGVVSREAQRGGLFVALLLYGLIWALLLASATFLLRFTTSRQAMVLALAAAWAVAIFPFLKYPANPPGVGEAETIVFRQVAYLASLAIALLGAGAAYALARRSSAALALSAYAALMVVAFLALPANPVPVAIPQDLLLAFRINSLAGLLVFWAVFALAYGWLFRRAARARRERLQPEFEPL